MDASAKSLPLAATERLEQAQALDGPARGLESIVRSGLGEGTLRDVLRGGWLGHALHPLLTDLPIGTWTSSLVLDFAGGSSAEGAADLLVGVGLAAVAPTALAGWSDWGESSTPEQRRVGLVHAAFNIAAAALFTASLKRRRESRRGSAKLLSVTGAGALGVGGYLGGHLSYARGVGVGER
ncbi:MAG: Ferredoxin, 2Fe-2S [Solirubrobacterales bacterium]|nr:Ferredoxin, 2Fe-2S [Solirubrobacterales bacterium]